ncbi:MAG: 30S ribosomal protein THX [Rhodanobacteraceae bacterium]|nr:30S ribosomal protein THX [Rhodanobacteraceae bacterium]MBK7044058.1 30S ribosomal protein THX [Rhodanobacteraceae bacterium]MBP9155452.1 30S ribosomal protein THX [Xanthomonadales bacterium]HQW80411.1 30S ribosomal protein THX [Pseudomonadota bacterium]
MGKGDRKTIKGKIFVKSYGNVRPHSEAAKAAAPAAKKAVTPAAKPAVKKAAPAKKKAAPAA